MKSRLYRNKVYNLITQFEDKIVDFYVTHGPVELRKKLNISNNDVWEIIIDYIGISHGAMQKFIKNNLMNFKEMIYHGKAGEIRSMFFLDKPKYNVVWEEILDFLLEEISIENFSYNTYEHSLNMFSNIYNQGRIHRKLKKSF